MSIEAIMTMLNFATIWLLIEAYYKHPRGYHGPLWFVALSYFVLVSSFIMLFLNVAIWVFTIMREG